jgi:hypothetical protein
MALAVAGEFRGLAGETSVNIFSPLAAGEFPDWSSGFRRDKEWRELEVELAVADGRKRVIVVHHVSRV